MSQKEDAAYLQGMSFLTDHHPHTQLFRWLTEGEYFRFPRSNDLKVKGKGGWYRCTRDGRNYRTGPLTVVIYLSNKEAEEWQKAQVT